MHAFVRVCSVLVAGATVIYSNFVQIPLIIPWKRKTLPMLNTPNSISEMNERMPMNWFVKQDFISGLCKQYTPTTLRFPTHELQQLLWKDHWKRKSRSSSEMTCTYRIVKSQNKKNHESENDKGHYNFSRSQSSACFLMI